MDSDSASLAPASAAGAGNVAERTASGRADVGSPPLEELLAAVGRGDEAAFAEIYRRTGGKLYAMALSILRDRALAEEALQEALVDVWRGAGSFRPQRGHALGWLVTVTRNRALRVARRRGAESAGRADELPQMPDTAADPLQVLERRADGAALARCLRALEADQRRAILLAYYRGLSQRQLAERLDRPLGTVKSWIRRGLAGLKRCLDEAHH